MKNEQILKKVIEKALNNGWNKKNITFNPKSGCCDMIFSHKFAKAFWGKQRVSFQFDSKKREYYYKYWTEKFGKDHGLKPAWKYFLQQMVLEEDPIKYLERFLDK